MRFNENGKITMNSITSLLVLAVLIVIVGISIRWLYQFVFEDSVGDATLKEVDARAIGISSRLMTEQDIQNNSEFGPVTKTGYPVTVYEVQGGFFEITLFMVPKSVCQYVVGKKSSFSTSVYINGVLKQSAECKKENTISFEFNRTLNTAISDADKPYKAHCQTNSDCGPCEECHNTICQSGCQEEEKCALAHTGKEMCCMPQNRADTICCSFLDEGECCWGRGKCCPMDKPIWLEDGRCVSCYDSEPFALGKKPNVGECLKFCPNRVPFGQDELCMLPVCEDGFFTDRHGDCINCDQQGGVATSITECSKCANRVYKNGMCVADCLAGNVMDDQGICRPCHEGKAFVVKDAASCSSMCPDRENTDGECRLKVCSDGFIRTEKGDCVSCDQDENIMNVSIEECMKCENRIRQGENCVWECKEGHFRSRDGECIPCETAEVVPVMVGDGECLKCPNRMALNGYCFSDCGAGYFRDKEGNCHSCQDKGSYEVLKTAVCHVCTNRAVQLKRENGVNQFFCRPGMCAPSTIVDEVGGCHECSEKEIIDGITKEECDKCINRMWSAEGHRCIVKPTCMAEEISDPEGACVSCYGPDEIINVAGREEECDKCDKRYVYGPWCRNCPADIRTLKDKNGCQKCGGHWDNRIAKCQI